MKSKNLQAIIFDFDGTISPTNLRQFQWFQYWAEKNHKELAHAKDGKIIKLNILDKFMNFYNFHCHGGGVQKVYDELGLPCDMNDKNHPVWPAYEEFKDGHPAGFYSGMKETLKELWEMSHLSEDPLRNRRLRLAINTTNTWKSIRKELVSEDVLHYFDSFITEEVLAQYHGAGNPDAIKKPSKISLALTLGLVGSEADRTLHIGDTLNDLSGSNKIIQLNPNNPQSIITAGVVWGYEGRERLERGVETPEGIIHFDYILDKPEEILQVVKELY